MLRAGRSRRTTYSLEVAAAIRAARNRRPSAGIFARELGESLGWGALSRQAIYDWETGRTRVPAVVLVAAAKLVQLSVTDLLQAGNRLGRPAGAGSGEWTRRGSCRSLPPRRA